MHDSDKKVILLHLLLKTEAGKMLEWLKRHAWKACKRLKRFTGSNPVLSAKKLVFTGLGNYIKEHLFNTVTCKSARKLANMSRKTCK